MGPKKPKAVHACPLNDLLWERIAEILRKRGKRLPDLWAKVERDKNTYTNWIRKRTIPKLSDLQELAAALGKAPADLLTPVGDATDPTSELPEQLDLPFGIGPKSVQFELQYTTSGLVLKRLGKAS